MDLGGQSGEIAFMNTPKPGDENFTRRPSIPDSLSSEPTSVQATPRPPRWWNGGDDRSSSAASDNPSHPTRGSGKDARFEDAPTPQKNQPEPKEVTAADMRMFLVSHDYNPKDIAYNSDGALIGATLPVLVEKLTPHDSIADPALWETFFLTFRLFTGPARLLEAIEARYDLTPPVRMPLQPETVRVWNEMKVAPIRLQLLALVRSWLTTYWQPSTDNEVAVSLRRFIEDRIAKAFPADHSRLLELLEKQTSAQTVATSPVARVRQLRSGSSASIMGTPYHRATFSMSSSNASLPPTPIMNKQLFSSLKNGVSQIHVTEFHALELARQLTLLESKLFCAIDPQDLIKLGKPRADSLKTMSTLSTRITGWVMDRILEETDLKKRTALLKYFIKLSNVSAIGSIPDPPSRADLRVCSTKRCLDLQNFSTLFAIVAALHNSTIIRLKRTWDVRLSMDSSNCT
jgi:son of sevenless-like protein